MGLCSFPRQTFNLMKLLQNWKSRLTEKRIAWLIRHNTMLGPERIQNLSRLAQRIEDAQIPGDVLECGVYKGGSAAIFPRLAPHSRLPPTFWLFHSFHPMPPPPPPHAPQPPPS